MAVVREPVEQMARAPVDDSDAVQVREVEGERVTVIELRIAPGDLGKVIDKQGRAVSRAGW